MSQNKKYQRWSSVRRPWVPSPGVMVMMMMMVVRVMLVLVVMVMMVVVVMNWVLADSSNCGFVRGFVHSRLPIAWSYRGQEQLQGVHTPPSFHELNYQL